MTVEQLERDMDGYLQEINAEKYQAAGQVGVLNASVYLLGTVCLL
jgi:hypothetical protein